MFTLSTREGGSLSITPANWPTFTLEIGFSSDPSTAIASTTWTDVTADLRSFETNTGRSYELDRFEAGTMRFVLNNRHRNYDPTNTTGAYYPNVLPVRRVRLRVVYNATTYAVWHGFIESVEQGYVPGRGTGTGDATATITAVDAFTVLTHAQLPASPYEVEVRADSPVSWWRLNEASGSTTAIDATGSHYDLTYQGTPTLGSAGLVAQDSSTSATFDHSSGQLALVASAGPITAFPFTVEAWIKVASASGSFRFILHQCSTTNPLSNYVGFYIPDSGFYDGTEGDKIVLSITTGDGSTFSNWNGGVIADNNIHHVAAVVSSYSSAKIYVDGADVTVTKSTTGSGGIPNGQTVIGNSAVVYGSSLGLGGQVQELAVYNSALSSARILAHYNAGKAGASGAWGNETSGTRVGRILDQISWPSADRNVDTGISTLQPTSLGETALEYLQTVEQTENGALYLQPDGKLRFRSRHAVLTASASTTSQATFGDSTSELQYSDIKLSYDDERIRNHIEVERDGGVTQIVNDTTSQTKYLKRGYTRTGMLHTADSESRDAANWLLAHYKDPDLRVTSITIRPDRAPSTLYPQVLGRVLGDRITVKRRPPGGGTISKDVLLEGVSHRVDIRSKTWETMWNLSPAETQTYWVLGTSSLGTDTRVGY